MLKKFALGLTLIIVFQAVAAENSLAQGYTIPPSTGVPSQPGGSRQFNPVLDGDFQSYLTFCLTSNYWSGKVYLAQYAISYWF